MRKQGLFLAASLVLLTAGPALAQKITASIRGTVTDASNAVVAGAKVTVRNEATGLTRSVTTNNDGIYSFPELPVGSYRVDVELAGFKAAAHTGIVLNVADVRAVDVELSPGEISEIVNVEGAALAVQTVGADVSGLITGEQARELPLNGRNFMQLTLLQPGVTALEGLNTLDKGLAGGSDISVSGGATTSNLWLVDGADNVDHGSNRTILVYPSVDAIEEFKIQRNNYGAEFGQAGGAQINLVTRGGTNDFHGSGYYFARRDSWNSKDYFLEQAGKDKAPLKWDDFGATIGGPVMKDKLHFFLSYEQAKDKRSEVRSSFVPTAAERIGDFSAAGISGCTEQKPIDPLTGQPFPGNVIPSNRINPAGRLMMQLMSLPNTSPTGGSCNNWVEAVSTPIDWHQFHGRADWSLTNSIRVMLRYTQDSWTATNANAGLWGDDPFPVVGSNWNQPGKSLVAQLNQNIGSKMTNALTFSYSANVIEVSRGGEDPALVEQITSVLPTLYPADIKQQRGAGQPMASWGSLGPYSNGVLWNQAPWLNNQDLYVLKDDFSAVFGRHFIKAGFLASYNKKNEEPANTSQESVVVNGTTGYLGPSGYMPSVHTGNTIGNWLLQGMVWNTSEIRTNKSVQQRWRDVEFYLADSYKVSPRVTADFGVRLSRLEPTYMADDQQANFDPSTVNPAFGNSPCNGLTYPPGTNPCPALGLAGGSDAPNRSLVPIKFAYVAPRLGVAWDVFGDGKTAIRGGLGLFYQRERVSPGLGVGQSPPFSGTASVTRTLDSTRPVVGSAAPSFGAVSNALELEAKNSHNWQWNLSAQREIVRNTVLEVAYVGSKGGDLVGQTNLNETPPQNRLAFIHTGDAALKPYGNIAGIGTGDLALWTHNRSSIYHGLQVALNSRFARGSSLGLAYTWSKVISDTGISNADGPGLSTNNAYTDSTQPDLDRARGGVDRTHIFSGSVILALPTLEDKSSFVRNVFGDWEITSIVQAGTGYPLTITASAPGLNGGLNGVGSGGNKRPNRVVDQPCTVTSSTNKTQWLNPAAFTLNGYVLGTNGTAGRHICDGPGIFQADASLYKNIKLGTRVKLQLRAEMYNVFNTVNLRGDGDFLNKTYDGQNVVYDTGNASTATRIISATPPGNFGQSNAARDPRTMQLGLRLTF
jgi:hypothetical protein